MVEKGKVQGRLIKILVVLGFMLGALWITAKLLWTFEIFRAQQQYESNNPEASVSTFQEASNLAGSCYGVFDGYQLMYGLRVASRAAEKKADWKNQARFTQICLDVCKKCNLRKMNEFAISNALALLKLERADEARSNLLSYLRDDPADAAVIATLAEVRLAENDQIHALDDINRALTILESSNPKRFSWKYYKTYSTVNMQAAAIFEKASKFHEAEQAILKVVTLSENEEEWEDCVGFTQKLSALYEKEGKISDSLRTQKQIPLLLDKQHKQEEAEREEESGSTED